MNNTKTLYFTIGIPGSGKSSWVKANPELYDKIICPNEIALQLPIYENMEIMAGQAKKIAFLRMEEYFITHNRIIYDDNMVAQAQRIELIDHARKCGAKRIEAIVFDCEPDVAIQRSIQKIKNLSRSEDNGQAISDPNVIELIKASIIEMEKRKKNAKIIGCDYIASISTTLDWKNEPANFEAKDMAWGEG